MRTKQVMCDGCGTDLSVRTNIEDYRLVLASESKPGYGAGVYTCMGIAPPVEREHHFCRLECLDTWRSRERAYDRLAGGKEGFGGPKEISTEEGLTTEAFGGDTSQPLSD